MLLVISKKWFKPKNKYIIHYRFDMFNCILHHIIFLIYFFASPSKGASIVNLFNWRQSEYCSYTYLYNVPSKTYNRKKPLYAKQYTKFFIRPPLRTSPTEIFNSQHITTLKCIYEEKTYTNTFSIISKQLQHHL